MLRDCLRSSCLQMKWQPCSYIPRCCGFVLPLPSIRIAYSWPNPSPGDTYNVYKVYHGEIPIASTHTHTRGLDSPHAWDRNVKWVLLLVSAWQQSEMLLNVAVFCAGTGICSSNESVGCSEGSSQTVTPPRSHPPSEQGWSCNCCGHHSLSSVSLCRVMGSARCMLIIECTLIPEPMLDIPWTSGTFVWGKFLFHCVKPFPVLTSVLVWQLYVSNVWKSKHSLLKEMLPSTPLVK